MKDEQQRDWEKTWIHFLCGALVGGIIGFSIWYDSSSNQSWKTAAAFVIAGGLLMGFLAGRFLDDFWQHLLDWRR